MLKPKAVLLALCAVLCVGCGKDDSGSSNTNSGQDTAMGTGRDTGTDDTAVPTHDADIQPIFTARCAACHISTASGGLSLANAYDQLVNVPAVEVPSLDLVEPSDTAKSYLWHKLKGTQASVSGSGSQMPRGGSLDPADLALIQAWIAGGAPR